MRSNYFETWNKLYDRILLYAGVFHVYLLKEVEAKNQFYIYVYSAINL